MTIFGAAAGAAVTVGITATSAQADPQPSIEDVQADVDALHDEAEVITEEYNGVKERADELEAQVEDLQDSAARTQEELNELRSSLGSVAAAQYRNGGLDPSVQLFLASDPDAYLSQASTLDQVSGRQAETLQTIETKQRLLDQQRDEAADALAELEDLRSELEDQQEDIQDRQREAQELLNTLTEEQQQQLEQERLQQQQEALDQVSRDSGRSDVTVDVEGSGYAGAALSAAATKLGSPYVYGAAGPSSFDCSGLTSWAYAQANVSLPRTSQAQAQIGPHLSQSELVPGDLVFFYGDLHHVGLYAGNGQILHAPRTGYNVEYLSINAMPFQFGVHVG
ncbi:C40 family peptidase [Streptomyces sp. RFCAC02]|uniref:C40 family peptidase n=1 Tax=Streptomyces sp. RFCAC02 TaxID=2499143 RepID=UPI0019D175D4|nr:C40 family peptidase [Streptomyces sp. RFCAC02]